jgi:hypothetical protein
VVADSSSSIGDYFSNEYPRKLWVDHHPLIRWFGILVKNLVGPLLFTVGLILATPGVPGPWNSHDTFRAERRAHRYDPFARSPGANHNGSTSLSPVFPAETYPATGLGD